MNLPIIVVNFKSHQQATGKNAIELAKLHERVAKETGASIAIAVNPLDLAAVTSAVNIPVFSQHLDPVSYGNHTGHVPADLVKEIGAYGTLLNHAEKQVDEEILRQSIERARELGLFSIVCADTPERAVELMKFNPDLVAVEPPELIGGDISVSKANPKIIEDAVRMIGQGRVLVGAGIKDADDLRIALDLGASGILLASGITKAEDPYAVLKSLVAVLKQA